MVWLAGLLVLAVATLQTRVPLDDLLLDRAQVGGGKWYDGMVTSLGVLAWTVAACACAGAGFASHVAGRGNASRTLGVAAALVVLLLLDDLFLLHSNVIPKIVGGPKLGLVLVEGALVGVWLVTCAAEIRRTRWELLLAAGCGLALSVVVDTFGVLGLRGDARLLTEDGAKFLGLLALALWAVSTALDVIRSIARAQPSNEPDAIEATSAIDAGRTESRALVG